MSPTDAEYRELQERVEVLETFVRLIKPVLQDPMFHSMLGGARRIPFPTRYTSPRDGKLGYVLRRAAGGGATFVAVPATDTDWSDA